MNVELTTLKQRLFGDTQVRNIKFFPGSDGDASPEDFAREINKFFADAEDSPKTFDPATDLDE